MTHRSKWTVAQWKAYHREHKPADPFALHGVSQGFEGMFYIIQLVPELDPCRIKFGFTSAIKTRLAVYHTICPNAKLLRSWPCRKSWESSTIDRLSKGSSRIDVVGGEVFRCADIEELLLRGDAFFATIPS